MTIIALKAARIRLAAKALRDHIHSTPEERQTMRELIALEDQSLAILADALARIPEEPA